MFKIYLAIVKASWQNFGLGWTFWQWSILMPCFLSFTHFTLWLDKLFFPQYQNIQVKEPIFIIGNPRSGTSFLHRQLTQTQEFAAFKTWQLIFPALTARFLFKPLVDHLIKTGRSTILPAHLGHELSLDQVEHEEFLFFYKLDTQFVTALSPLAYDDQEFPELRWHDQQPPSRRLGSINFLKECLQRQLYITGSSRVISHLHFSVHRVQSLLEIFPDAKFIYLVRSPYETIPSHLSLNYNMINYKSESRKIPEQKINRFLHRRYSYDVELYRYFHDLQEKREDIDQTMCIMRYSEIINSLEEAFSKIIDYAELEPSDELHQLVKRADDSQRRYKRQHRIIDLNELGLTHQRIQNDLDFIFKEYELL